MELTDKRIEDAIQVAGALLSSKRTLTDRVQALENDMRSVKKDIEALKSKGQSGK